MLMPAILAILRLALTLFMLGGFTNYTHDAFSAYDFAFITDSFYRCSYFHNVSGAAMAVGFDVDQFLYNDM